MEFRCPGNDLRKLKVALYICPKCKNEVEMFSDESAVHCQRCGEIIEREQQPSCIEWCSSARQCLKTRHWKLGINE